MLVGVLPPQRARLLLLGVPGEPDLGRIVLLQELPVGQLGDRDREDLERQVHDRHQVGDDQNDVLGHLGPGDRLHAAEHRAEQHAGQAEVHSVVVVDPDESGHDEADPGHLGHQVGERADDGPDHAHDARRIAAVARAQEVRDRVGAELAEVRPQEHGEEQVAPRPAHHVPQSEEPLGRDQAGHGDERGRRHPVRAGGHAVVDGGDTAPGDVVLVGVGRAGEDADEDVDGERQRHVDPADPLVRQAEGQLEDPDEDRGHEEADRVETEDLVQAHHGGLALLADAHL